MHELDKYNCQDAESCFFERAAGKLGLEGNMVEFLRTPFREIKVEIPLVREDRRLEIFSGYRVQHNNVLGPFEERVNSELDKTLIHAAHRVFDTAERERVDYRTAAYMIAVDRVAKAIESIGF